MSLSEWAKNDWLKEHKMLKWDCIDFENRLLTVKRSFCQKTQIIKETTKTHTARRIGICDALFELLKKLVRMAPEGQKKRVESLACSVKLSIWSSSTSDK